MAYLRATPHYKGSFPLDCGGFMLGGFGQKECTPDRLADMIAAANFPFIVKCDRLGTYLVDVPALTTEPAAEIPAQAAEIAVDEKSDDSSVDSDQNSEALSASIEIEKPTPKVKKGK